MENKKRIVIMAVLPLVVTAIFASPNKRNLHEGWQFSMAGTELWHPAVVPGNTHLDLMRERMIEDPFFRLNERAVQWVDKEDWIYQTSLFPTAEELASHTQTLVFTGLDTYADVYLNDSLLGSSDNMFRTWRWDVKGILHKGSNTLRVHFRSPIRRNLPIYDALPYQHNYGPENPQLGGVFDKPLAPLARTATYEYGWDWGPRLVTFGIWKPVYLETWSGLRLADVFYNQKEVTRKRAKIQALVEIESDQEVDAAQVTITADGHRLATKNTRLHPGKNQLQVDLTIPNPRLWWSNGLGEQYLTVFNTTVSTPTCHDASTTEVGLRSIRVVTKDDADGKGRGFYFELNGEPVFAKGANLIPLDNLPARVTDADYLRMVQSATDVNMNMLRVWGGGLYESDAFYHYCDSLGIMVWQDFTFACESHEVDSAFAETVRQEAIDNVCRLRNHASLALWCGSNEEQDEWFLVKKDNYDPETSRHIGDMQRHLFCEILPDVVREYGGNTFYWPSSPYSHPDAASQPEWGDSHYWWVWHGALPIEAYYEHRSRIVSEYGFQSFPEYESVLRYNPDKRDHDITSEVMMLHQKAGSFANGRIRKYMEQDYRVPEDFAQFLYVGQVLQADAIRMGMEGFRARKPYCMGSLYWQLNDCWPVASWASIDYYGRWKALHYAARKSYDDILVSLLIKHGPTDKPITTIGHESNVETAEAISDYPLSDTQMQLKLVSDRLRAVSGTLRIKSLTLTGRTVHEETRRTVIPKNGCLDLGSIPVASLIGEEVPNDVIIYVSFETADGHTYYNIGYPVRQKDMHLRHADIKHTLKKCAGGYEIELTTDVFARAVYLKTKGTDDFFTDNYFDLLPGEKRCIRLRTSKSMEEVEKELQIISLADTGYPFVGAQ